MINILLSDEYPKIINNLKEFGYEAIVSETIDNLLPFERKHADIQCLKINDTFFVLKNCKNISLRLKQLGKKVIETDKFAESKYPRNILLNGLFINNMLLCKKDAIDNKVKEYCDKHKINIINVNQGYTKCSTALIGDKFITSDIGIYKALIQNGVEGLLINPGGIDLNGVDYGFIGGCCFSDEYNVYFTGNIKLHKDYDKIEKFCHRSNKNIICLSSDKLYDIGGFVVI